MSVDQRSLHSFCKIIGQLVLMEVVTVVVVVVVVVEQKKEVTMTMLQFSTDNRSLKLFYFSQLICNCVGALGKKLQCNENSQD